MSDSPTPAPPSRRATLLAPALAAHPRFPRPTAAALRSQITSIDRQIELLCKERAVLKQQLGKRSA